MLGGFRLQLARRADIGNQCNMDVQHVVFTHILFYLANRFQEGKTFDIAYGAADLSNHKIRVFTVADPEYPGLDFIGNVGNDLNRTAQVIAPALLRNDGLVNFTSGHIGTLGQVDVNKAFIMAQIQVRLRAVVRHEHFAVLVRAHGSRINIDIGIELLHRNLIAPALQQTPQGSCRNAFPQRGYHAACNENILGCH